MPFSCSIVMLFRLPSVLPPRLSISSLLRIPGRIKNFSISFLPISMASKPSDISVVFLDVDGVLTNGSIFVSEHTTFRSYSVLDGMGLKLLIAAGIHIVVISGGSGHSITRRLTGLGISAVYTKITDKLSIVKEVLTQLSLDRSQACFLGDDINDVEAMSYCGLSFAPLNAHSSALSAATHRSSFAGGDGFVRYVADLLLATRTDTLSIVKTLTND